MTLELNIEAFSTGLAAVSFGALMIIAFSAFSKICLEERQFEQELRALKIAATAFFIALLLLPEG